MSGEVVEGKSRDAFRFDRIPFARDLGEEQVVLGCDEFGGRRPGVFCRDRPVVILTQQGQNCSADGIVSIMPRGDHDFGAVRAEGREVHARQIDFRRDDFRIEVDP